jgi:hypothetical protein
VSSHQFCITVVDASRGHCRFGGIEQLRVPADGRKDLAVDFGFIKLSQAIAEIGGLGNLRVYSGIAQTHKEFYVVVWIIVGVNIDPHQVLPYNGFICKAPTRFSPRRRASSDLCIL